MVVRRFSPVSSTNKTDRHDITEILLKVALNTIKTNKQIKCLHPPPQPYYLVSDYLGLFFSTFVVDGASEVFQDSRFY